MSQRREITNHSQPGGHQIAERSSEPVVFSAIKLTSCKGWEEVLASWAWTIDRTLADVKGSGVLASKVHTRAVILVQPTALIPRALSH